MENATDTRQLKFSPTSTPILDGLRPLPRRRWVRVNAGEYFFLSGAVILGLIGLPVLRRAAGSLAERGTSASILIPCFLIPAAALLLSLAAHEAGHLAAAWLAGFGRIQRSSAPDGKTPAGTGDWACDIVRIAALSLEPRKPDHIRARLFLLFAGGPAANFMVPAVLEILYWTNGWGALAAFSVHLFAALSILQGIADLLPDSGRGNFSDGSRMVMLIRNDDSAQRWLAIIRMLVAVRAGDDPSIWSEDKIVGINAVNDQSRDEVAARWLGYVWGIWRQDITSATRYLESALESAQAASGGLCDRLFFEAALFQAWYRDDAAKARFWAAQMHRQSAGPLQQPRLVIALMWADGKLFDAWEKLLDYLSNIQSLPASPLRDLTEKQALEWKTQMEPRMLARAWRTIYSMSQEVEKSASQEMPAKA